MSDSSSLIFGKKLASLEMILTTHVPYYTSFLRAPHTTLLDSAPKTDEMVIMQLFIMQSVCEVQNEQNWVFHNREKLEFKTVLSVSTRYL